MILVIDNYDSFTYNLAHSLRRASPGTRIEIHRNDRVTTSGVVRRRPQCIVISPGPGHPGQAGLSPAIIAACGDDIPLLGVCLGHQCIAEVHGARIGPAGSLVHGKSSAVHHHGTGLFQGLPCPVQAARYHSLAVHRESLPTHLEITAWTADGEIMGLRHRHAPLWGVQFHPESFLTTHGDRLVANFLTLAGLQVAT